MGDSITRLPDFFSIYVPDCSSEKLKIPYSFFKHLGESIPEAAILKTCTGQGWPVSLSRTSKDAFFDKGWKGFIKDNHIVTGELLVFRYARPYTFEVRIFDHSCCEKGEKVDDQKLPNGKSNVADAFRAEQYLDDFRNPFILTEALGQNRNLPVSAKVIGDYNLRFGETVTVQDPIGSLEMKVSQWEDGRIVICRWNRTCRRNKVRSGDKMICEFMRGPNNLVRVIKVQLLREGSDLP